MRPNMINIIWLAARQMRDNWLAYPGTMIYFLFMGAILANDASNAREFGQIMIMIILIQPAISSRYMTLQHDNEVLRHQVFLRTLPVPFATIVWARLIAMLAAGFLNAPAYFLPFWFLGDAFTGVGAYIGWLLFWLGIAIALAMVSLYQEFALSVRRWSLVNLCAIVVLIILIVFDLAVTGWRPVGRSVDLANSHAWLAAAIGIAITALSLIAGPRLAVSGFRRRELTI